MMDGEYVTDWHTNLPIQAAMADFVRQGMFARHLRRVRRVYRQRHERIAAALAGPLSAHLAAVPSAAGLHLSAMVRGTLRRRRPRPGPGGRRRGWPAFRK